MPCKITILLNVLSTKLSPWKIKRMLLLSCAHTKHSDYRASKVPLSTDKKFCHFYNSIIIIYDGPLSVIKASIFCSLRLAPVGHKRNYALVYTDMPHTRTSLYSMWLWVLVVVGRWVMNVQLSPQFRVFPFRCHNVCFFFFCWP